MKAVNFWKTLFCAAMAITAFTACSDDDDEGGFSGQPSITVNGEKSTAVAGKYAEGDTPAVDVVSTGKWTLTFDNADDAKWCTPKPASGNAGTTKLVFNLSSTNTDRQAVVTLITEGIIEGISIPAKATITVKQNKNGTTTVETNVKDIREEVTFAEITDNSKIQDAAGNQITESKVITGIVVSDYVGNNINNHQIMLTDNTTEAGAGLMIRFVGYVGNKATDHNLTCGSIVSFDLKNGYAKIFKGAYVVTFVGQDPTITIEDEQDNTPAAIEVTDPSKLIDYQSQYVKVYSQPTESYRGQNYYTNTGTTEKPSYYYYPIYQMKDGQTFKLTVSSYCSWATSLPIPAKAGSMLGCVSVYDSADLAPRNAADVAGMTEDLFEVTAAKTTISQITATGDYEIQGATVVATYQQGFVMQDNTGAILVFCGTEATLPAVGDVVTVTGTVAEYGDALQFDKGATVTKTGTATYTPSTPTDVTADNITGMMTAPKATYVKMTGKLSAGSFVNVDFLFDTNYTGSITSPNADLNVASFDGKIVDVEGWFVNNGAAKGNGKYFTVVATKIAENTTMPNIKTPSQKITFVGAGEAKDITYEAVNVAASNTIYAKLSGTNAANFEVTTAPANGKLTVTAKANSSSDEYTATLTLYAAASEDATPVASTEITLVQDAGKQKNMLAGWVFTNNTDMKATSGNTEAELSRVGVTTAISFTGSSKTIWCNGWNGADAVEKYWLLTIPVKTAIPANSTLTIDWQAYGTKTSPKNWDIEYSVDKTTWTKVGSVVYPDKIKDFQLTQVVPVEIPAGVTIYIRYKVNGTTSIEDNVVAEGGNSRLANIEVFY